MGPWFKTFGSFLVVALGGIGFALLTDTPPSANAITLGVALLALFRTHEQEPRP